MGAGALIGVVDAAYRGRSEEAAFALAVSAPEIGTFFFFGDALALDIRRGDGMIDGEHSNHVFAAMLIIAAAGSVITAHAG